MPPNITVRLRFSSKTRPASQTRGPGPAEQASFHAEPSYSQVLPNRFPSSDPLNRTILRRAESYTIFAYDLPSGPLAALFDHALPSNSQVSSASLPAPNTTSRSRLLS